MYDKLGKAAIRFAVAYARRRYRREIRIGIGVTAVVVGIGAYLAQPQRPRGLGLFR